MITPQELELHNAAWKAAKIELFGSVTADIPFTKFSAVALRADIIRKDFKVRTNG